MYLCNTHSLVNKISIFQSVVYGSGFHIIAITETWLSEAIFDTELLPNGYCIFRKDRGSRGGGVLFAVDQHLPAVQLDTPCDLEVLTVKISFDHPAIFSVVYVPPNVSLDIYNSLLDYLYSFFSSASSPVFVLGDFNIPNLHWDTFWDWHSS